MKKNCLIGLFILIFQYVGIEILSFYTEIPILFLQNYNDDIPVLANALGKNEDQFILDHSCRGILTIQGSNANEDLELIESDWTNPPIVQELCLSSLHNELDETTNDTPITISEGVILSTELLPKPYSIEYEGIEETRIMK